MSVCVNFFSSPLRWHCISYIECRAFNLSEPSNLSKFLFCILCQHNLFCILYLILRKDTEQIVGVSSLTYYHLLVFNVNPIQDGGGKKAPPTSFSPVTSTNAETSPKNFLTFSFNAFVTLVWNFKFVTSASPKLLKLNQDHPSKKKNVFLVKSL